MAWLHLEKDMVLGLVHRGKKEWVGPTPSRKSVRRQFELTRVKATKP